jgi:predicted TIM-barrel fold metal-dependent hydrolase
LTFGAVSSELVANRPAESQRVGVDNVMFETDYPHPTCLYGEGLDKVANALATLPDADKRKVLGGNAAKLYNISID